MNIWLDDQRQAPDNWIHLHNIEEVERFISVAGKQKDFCIDTMSFDYHLSHPKRGVDVMKYLVQQCEKNKSRRFWPKTVLYHSNDPEGIEIMKVFTTSFEKDTLPKYSEQHDVAKVR